MADSKRRMINDTSLVKRLDAALRLAKLPARSRATTPTNVGPPEALLARLSALTTAIDERKSIARWDDADRLTAQLLLSDLALVAGHLRTVVQALRARLTTGHADLESCRNLITDVGTDPRPISRR